MSFEEFKDKIRREINQASLATNEQLSDQPERLMQQLNITEQWYSRLLYLMAQADFFYQTARHKALMPRGNGITELDREMKMHAEAAKEKATRDWLSDVAKGLSVRISLGQSELSYLRQFKEREIQ